LAYEIIKRLQNLGDFETLELLRKFMSAREKKNGKLHNVFQPLQEELKEQENSLG
jgi:hypothetical protein